MLVLSRKVGQRILVRDQEGNVVVAVTVVRIGPNAVRLGIEADKEWSIVRKELGYPNSSPQADHIPSIQERISGKIQPDESDLEDLGRSPRGEFLEADEFADAYVESKMIDHGC